MRYGLYFKFKESNNDWAISTGHLWYDELKSFCPEEKSTTTNLNFAFKCLSRVLDERDNYDWKIVEELK